MRLFITLIISFICGLVQAQTELVVNYNDGNKNLKLQAFEYRPTKWNGQVIIMNHGSTGGGGNPRLVYKFTQIAKEVTDQGYIFLTYMRKGRGNSEGDFTEETGRCGLTTLNGEFREAADQLKQVVQQVKITYRVNKVFLMGWSRGGFLSSMYASENPEEVSGVVSLAGVWSAFCESRGGFSKFNLEESAKKFNKQIWVYVSEDSYFQSDKFNDPNYEWFDRVAQRYNINLFKYKNSLSRDGHFLPVLKPEVWAKDAFPLLKSYR